jgi:histidinol-phosphate aminotransferase
VARPEWIGEINKVRMPYNINVLTQKSVEFALNNFDALQQQTSTIVSERNRFAECLGLMEGCEVFPSESNFVLARFTARNAEDVFEALKKEGVLVKNLHGGHALLDSCLRLTVGSPEENERLLASLEKILQV